MANPLSVAEGFADRSWKELDPVAIRQAAILASCSSVPTSSPRALSPPRAASGHSPSANLPSPTLSQDLALVMQSPVPQPLVDACNNACLRTGQDVSPSGAAGSPPARWKVPSASAAVSPPGDSANPASPARPSLAEQLRKRRVSSPSLAASPQRLAPHDPTPSTQHLAASQSAEPPVEAPLPALQLDEPPAEPSLLPAPQVDEPPAEPSLRAPPEEGDAASLATARALQTMAAFHIDKPSLVYSNPLLNLASIPDGGAVASTASQGDRCCSEGRHVSEFRPQLGLSIKACATMLRELRGRSANSTDCFGLPARCFATFGRFTYESPSSAESSSYLTCCPPSGLTTNILTTFYLTSNLFFQDFLKPVKKSRR